MARIVLDLPKLRPNPRFKALVRKCHSEWEAVGMLADFYEGAQDMWAEKKLMTKEEFGLAGFNPILEVGLAEERDGGIYAKGGAERFEWLLERVQAGKRGGKKSAEVRKLKYGTAQPHSEANPKLSFENLEAIPKQARSSLEAPPKPTVTSTSLLTTEEKTKTLKPFQAEGRLKDGVLEGRHARQNIARERSIEKRAIAVADQMLAAVKKFDEDEEAAKAALPPFAWQIIMHRFNSWEEFNLEAFRAYKAGKETFFIHQLRESVTSWLLHATDRGA